MDFGFGGAPSMAQLAAILGNDAPPPEAVAAKSGAAALTAREDHQHPGLTSAILPSLSGIGLLTGLITALSNLNVFGGSAAGAQFCCIALQPSA